jgi:hypothetical protein
MNYPQNRICFCHSEGNVYTVLFVIPLGIFIVYAVHKIPNGMTKQNGFL